MATTTKTAKQPKELISAATVNRVISKAGEVLGYRVKSNSSNDYYSVRGSKVNGKCVYFCDCQAGQNNFQGCKDGACCHVKAVKEVVAARREIAKEQGNNTPAAGCLGEQVKMADEVVQGGVRSEYSPIDKVFEDDLQKLAWQKEAGQFPVDPWAGLDESQRRLAYCNVFQPNNY